MRQITRYRVSLAHKYKDVLAYIRKHHVVLKERLVFTCIFIVIAVPMTVMFVHTYNQSTALAEKKLQEEISKVKNALNILLLTDYTIENKRSYKDYGILNSISVIGGNGRLFSEFFSFPDSSGPYCDYDSFYRQCQKGLVGHFQISHNGELLTPFYPDTSTGIGKSMWDNFSFDDQKQRKQTRDRIQSVLKQLDIKNNVVKKPMQVVDSIGAIDQLWSEAAPDVASATRIESTSEEEAITYMAETAKNDTNVKVPLPIFMGSNMNVNITDLTAKMSDEYLVFYRKIYIGKLPIMQGFVVDKKIYLNYIATRLLNGEPNTPFAIEVYDGSEMIMNVWKMKPHYKLVASDPVIPPFRSLQLRIYTAKSANIGEISILITGFLLLLVIGAGLVTIYRFIQSKVALASKRQDFVSAITHELKTPLTAIKMYAEILQMSKAATEEKKQKYYGLIASESERLSRLIQNVLNLSKLDGNRWNVQLRKGKPKEVLDDFLAGYSKNIENQGFELTVTTDADADKIYLMIDRDAVMQILMNLVDNSLKFSKKAEYKMINIELAIKGNDMYLAVRDYGPGIPPEEMKKVFQEFYRVENEMTRQTSGTGIGLSMVKKLCSLTGMRIEIENAYPGLRTKIHFPSLSF